jgi:hypothetical protein
MFRRLVQVAPLGALLAIGMPEPPAASTVLPSLHSDEALVLVGEGDGGRRGGRDGNARANGRDGGEARRHRHSRRHYFGYAGCETLRREAIASGSRQLWRRYEACRRGW